MTPHSPDQWPAEPQTNSHQNLEGQPVSHVLANVDSCAIGTMNAHTTGHDSLIAGPGGAIMQFTGPIGVLNLISPAPASAALIEKGNDLEKDTHPVDTRDCTPLQARNRGEPPVDSTVLIPGPSTTDTGVSLIPLEDIDIPTSSSRPTLPPYAEIYVRGLLSSEYGLPCWRPGPCDPDEQPRGVVPGDVGIYSLGGRFKRIFNLWKDEGRIRELVATQGKCECGKLVAIRGKGECGKLGGRITTDHGILQAGEILAPTATCTSPHPRLSDEVITVHEIRCPPKTPGAILAVLSPADLEATNDNQAMQIYILQHVEPIFRLANSIHPIPDKESLYIITGCIKTDVWGIAAYQKLEGKESQKVERVLELTKTAIPVPTSPAASYRWARQPPFSNPRIGDSGTEGLKNQTLFLQGFKLAFSPSFYFRMKRTEEVTSTASDPTNEARSDNQDHFSGQPDSTPPAPGSHGPLIQNQCGPQMQGGPLTSLNSNFSLDVSAVHRVSKLYLEGGTKEEIELLQFPHLSEKPYHPSDIINQILLEATGASVALSHDDDWRTLRRESADRLLTHNSTGDESRPSRTVSVQDGVAYVVMRRDPHETDWDPNSDPDYKQDPDHERASDCSDPLGWAYFLRNIQCLKIPSDQIGPIASDTPGGLHIPTMHYPFASGGYGDVFRAFWSPHDGKRVSVAIKVLRGAWLGDAEHRSEYARRYQRECDVWKNLRHPNILRFEGLVVSDNLPGPGMVSGYKKHGDLHRFMEEGHRFDRLHMVQGITCGLAYLHENRVVHADLTTSSILVDVSATGSFVPLISDFGESRILGVGGFLTSKGGAQILSRPPELLDRDSEEEITNMIMVPGSDVYSMSLIFIEVLTGKKAYSEERRPEWKIVESILFSRLRPTRNKYPMLDEKHDFIWPIMEDCWKHKPSDRITSAEAYRRLCASSSTDCNPTTLL